MVDCLNIEVFWAEHRRVIDSIQPGLSCEFGPASRIAGNSLHVRSGPIDRDRLNGEGFTSNDSLLILSTEQLTCAVFLSKLVLL
jgi:hypothetical protein